MAAAAGSNVKVMHTKCKSSASLLPNNLSADESTTAYVHRSEFHVMKLVPPSSSLAGPASLTSAGAAALAAATEKRAQNTKGAYAEKDPVSQVRHCKLAELGEVLVLVTLTGLVHVYDTTGQRLIHFFRLPKATGREAQLRGITHDGGEHVTVGSGTGELLVFNITSKKINLTQKLAGHNAAITDCHLSLTERVLASADETGSISLWDAADGKDAAYTKIADFAPSVPKEPCWSVQIGHGFLVAAFSTGHIRLYSLEKKKIAAEIAAHARSINGLDIHPTIPMFCAASEDSFVSVWTLPTAAAPSIRNLLMQSPSAALLTGCRFAGSGYNEIAVAAFDSRFIATMPAPKP